MLIGVSGTLSSGKTEVTRYLTFQGFKLIELDDNEEEFLNGSEITLSEEKEFEVEKNGNLSKTPVDEASKGSIQACSMDPFKRFVDLQEMLEFVTSRWREDFVISHISDIQMLHQLQKRPFFLHISIDAPIQLRYGRYLLRQGSNAGTNLEDFISKNDELLFASSNPLIEINNQAQIKIINTSSSIKNLYIKLSELKLRDQSRLRPTWDSYFMRLADLAALRSNCMKRRVGCVIARENRVIATGYNGTPRHLTNCNEGGCERCNKGQGSGAGLSTCLCLHAEENALLEAGRDRIRGDSVLYCNTCPCLTCSIKIVQSGIKEVVYAQSYSMDTLSHNVMSEAGIILRQFLPPTEGIFI
ncbi:uncharacterized protein PRCAT00004063001 [Priceomyces carsonii]|uniref:uncharacterized protein n=1 Tax=Priceomyces carsonii TaxID=28549 RepID=UPI002ED80995|nr:unnamed protein product [Priceomyces carsonii]